MSLDFRAAKGCVYSVGKSGGKGFYALSPGLQSSAGGGAILMDGVDGGESDSIFLVKTLDRKKYIYVFGEDFGELSIRGIALLGKATSGGAAFSAVKSYFDTNRVSASNKAVTVSMPGSASMRCYIHQLSLGAPDSQYHAQPFMFRASVVTPR
jgi:hypothetical protein